VIEADADSEPLDVGDLLGDDDPSSTSEVRMLRGESSFMPDEDSLQLRSNPLTGELMFQVPTDDGLPPDSPTDDDMLVVESPELADDVEDVDESSRDDTGETSSDDEARRS
jgi:glucuronate isomerase